MTSSTNGVKTIRASALNSAVLCPASLTLAEGGARQATQRYLDEGSRGHSDMARKIQHDETSGDWLQTIIRPCRETTIVEQECFAMVRDIALTGHVDCAYTYRIAASDSLCLTVVDWKFSHDTSIYPPIAEDLQLISYAYMLRAEYASDVIHIIRAYPLTETSDECVFDSETWPLAEAYLATAIADIAENEHEFRPGVHCTRCLYRDRCEYFEARAHCLIPFRGAELVVTRDNVDDLYVALKAGEELCDKVKQAITAYLRECDGERVRLSRYTRETVSDQREAVRAVLSATDDPVEHLTTSVKALKTLGIEGMTRETTVEKIVMRR